MRGLNTLGLGLLGGGLLLAAVMAADMIGGRRVDMPLLEVAATFALVGAVLVFATRSRLSDLPQAESEIPPAPAAAPLYDQLPSTPPPAGSVPAPSLLALAARSADLKDALPTGLFAAFVAIPTVGLWSAWRHGFPWMQIVFSVLFGAAAWRVARYVRAALRDMATARALFREGSAAYAVVARVVEARRSMGATSSIIWSVWAVEYVFHDAEGRRRHGTSEASGAQAKRLRIGERIVVHYDAAAPNRSAWLGTRA